MRLVLALTLATSGCIHAARFGPAVADQAVAGQPEAVSAEGAGVRVIVHAGGWRGAPDDLQDRLTPIEAYVENESGRAIRLGPEEFTLLAPNGFRYQALEPREVQRLAGATYGSAAVVYYGVYGAYPWPGFWRPWHRHGFYPYAWWGWYGPPVAVPAPVERPPATPRGTLENGGNVSLLLFYPVPAQSLSSFQIIASLADDAGKPVTTIRLALVREGTAPPPPPPAPPASTPTTPAPGPPPPRSPASS